MDYNLSSGLLEEIMRGTEEPGVQPIMQVLGCKRITGSQGNYRYSLLLSDGKHIVSFVMLVAQLNVIVERLSTFSIVKILQYVTSNLQSLSKGDRRILILINLEVVTSGDVVGKKIGSPTQLNMTDIEQDDCSSTSHSVASKNTSYSNSMSTASSSKSPTKVVNAVNGSSSSEPGLIHPIESINPYQSGTGQSSSGSTHEVSLIDIQKLKLGSNAVADYFHVNAYIGMITTDNITYMACPKPECDNEVEIWLDLYRCDECYEYTPNFKYRYLMQMDICDYSGHMWVSAFANEYEKILLKTADEMGKWLEQDEESATEYILSKCFKMYLFKCRIENLEKLEEYRDHGRFRTTIMNVSDVDYPKYNNLLITGIKNLLKIE